MQYRDFTAYLLLNGRVNEIIDIYMRGAKMERKSTYGLKLEQLTKLLSIGAGDAIPPDGFCEDEMIASHLLSQLGEPLCEDSPVFGSLSAILEQGGLRAGPLVGKTLCQVMLDEKTSPKLLEAFKTFGKRLSFTVVHETESSVGVTLYHTSIASALVHHSEKISRSSYEELGGNFDLLIGKKWMLKELVVMLTKARDICRKKQEAGK